MAHEVLDMNILDLNNHQCMLIVLCFKNLHKQLSNSVDYVIIDEGQEISTSWYTSFAESLKTNNIGITILYNLNQLRASHGL